MTTSYDGLYLTGLEMDATIIVRTSVFYRDNVGALRSGGRAVNLASAVSKFERVVSVNFSGVYHDLSR